MMTGDHIPVVPGLQLWIGRRAPSPKRLHPIQNMEWPRAIMGKPKYGLWTSSWHAGEQTSEWLDWLRWEQPDWLEPCQGWLLTPRPDAKVIVIDSLTDLNQCIRTWRRTDLESDPLRHVRQTDPTLLRHWHEPNEIDYEAMHKVGYAGVHLTSKGQLRTRHSMPSLYGWDVECTIWFEWAFTDVQPVPAEVIHQTKEDN